MIKSILITGGRALLEVMLRLKLLSPSIPDYQIVNLDALTYAGNSWNLKRKRRSSKLYFRKGSILKMLIFGLNFES